MNKQIPIWICIFILLVSTISAYTFNLDEAEITEGQTLIAEITTTTGSEKNDPYTVYWYKADGTLLETDTGTMSGIISGTVFETYISVSGDATTNGNSSFDLNNNGVDEIELFNISTVGVNVSVININDAKFSPSAKIGYVFAADLRLTVDNKTIDSAHCSIYGTDENDAPLQTCTVGNDYVEAFDGRVTCDRILAGGVFLEGEQYIAKVRCHCNPTDNTCYDEDRKALGFAKGSTAFVFEVEPWLSSVSTLTDKTSYTLDDEYLQVCVNVTNTGTERIPLDINYNYRCSETGLDSATDRDVVAEYREYRGISANTTQNQCALLPIINIKSIQNKKVQCYAATDVGVIFGDLDSYPITYHTTSSQFNITSNSNVLAGGDNMGSLAIMIFILLITGGVFYLSSLNFTKNEWSNFAIKRGIIVVGIYLMVMNSAIAATIADVSGIPISKEMFRYMWFFGIAGYVSMLYLMFTSVLGTIKLWKDQQTKLRLGEQ